MRKVRLLFSFVLTMFATLLLVPSVFAGSATVNGELTTSDAFDGCDYYDLFPFTVSESGNYDMDVTSPVYTFDTYLYLFASIDDANAKSNILTRDDDDSSDPINAYHSLIEGFPLVANTQYVLRMEGFSCGNLGAYEITWRGPGEITFGSPSSSFQDSRLNRFDAAAPIVVYPITINGAVGMNIYAADGTFLFQVTAEEIAAILTSPAENTPIKVNGAVQVWRLSTGEIQINAPQYNGKTYVLKFTDINSSADYVSYEEE